MTVIFVLLLIGLGITLMVGIIVDIDFLKHVRNEKYQKSRTRLLRGMWLQVFLLILVVILLVEIMNV